MFAPLAWLKLQFFCHAGPTEVDGFGISAADRLLYVEDFVTVRQQTTPVSVRFFDDSVADYFDRCADAGLSVQRTSRIWCHTHPGTSAMPSGTDEETFARVFGRCDWSVMFIVGRTGNTYARLSFSAGPGGQILLPTGVDWSAWPSLLDDSASKLADRVASWKQEFAAQIEAFPGWLPTTHSSLADDLLDEEWWEQYEWEPALDIPVAQPLEADPDHERHSDPF